MKTHHDTADLRGCDLRGFDLRGFGLRRFDLHARRCLPVLIAGAALWLSLLASPVALGDSLESTCVIYPAGEDHSDDMVPCVFSQRQGYVTLRLESGPTHELTPTGEAAGNFTDQQGRPVYRQSGLDDKGLIFRFPDESIYVYWGRAMLEPDDADNPTAPFSTADYDATTLLPCTRAEGNERGSCPAGILRMDGGQASIVVQDLDGEQFTINFLDGVVNATNRTADATLEGDTWTVVIDGDTVFTVPLAAIEGG